jgi:succinate-semialdehyde dehydrogenase/glutarate-semialdehyde dehydrogenase
MESINPATGDVVGQYERDSDEDVAAALDTAEATFEDWRDRSLREREQLIESLADVLRDNKQEYAELMTAEMGKPISQAVGEIEKCAWGCEHYAEYAHAYLSDDIYPSEPGTRVKTQYDPLGTVLAVMPWNYPFWQVIRFAAPYITAGNVGVLKHAPEVPGVARAIDDAFDQAGYPEGVFQSLLVDPDTVHDQILADDRVRAATLTGSSRAGRAVASTAGDQLDKTVLELGGSDPYIVLEDADIEQAAEIGAWARMQNAGQTCIAAKRIFVHEAVYEEFEELFLDEIDSLVVGDPTDEATDVGSLVSQDHLDTVHRQITETADAGATLLRGGEQLDREGAFYEPTVFTDVPPGCPATEDEVFGPAAVLERVSDETEAVQRANSTDYGLAASIWTEDRERGERLAGEIDAGCVYVNQMSKSDPRVPFGGVKDSGYGRELSEVGMKEFVNRKTVWVE